MLHGLVEIVSATIRSLFWRPEKPTWDFVLIRLILIDPPISHVNSLDTLSEIWKLSRELIK